MLNAARKFKPYSVQLEFVKGCNFNCLFCGNYSLPEEKAFMDKKTLLKTAKEIRFFGKVRIELALRGEPTLHPDYIGFTKILRYFNPDSQITLLTNGSKAKPEVIKDWFKAGGNVYAIDCYNDTEKQFSKKLKGENLLVKSIRDFNVWENHGSKRQTVVLIPDIEKDNSAARKLTNQCGAINPEAYKVYGISKEVNLKKKCYKPFREISVFYNGDVPLCCLDWIGENILFNVHKGMLKKYWLYNKKLNKARVSVLEKNRNFIPCKKCNFFGGFRLGLLPKLEFIRSLMK